MSEGAANTVVEYGRLIEEVFIKPIKTVVVVDDEFPTLDALLNKEMDNTGLGWKPENVKLAREIIDFCRDEKRCWLADIHDGPQSSSLMLDGKSAAHLHQSDLMILDYHLDKARPDDGSKAICILRELADNDYFNLVVVYTKGDQEAGGDIARVVREIAVGLCSLDDRLMLGEKSLQDFVSKLEKWEDDVPDIEEKLLGEVDNGLYLKARTQLPDSNVWGEIDSLPELQRLKTLVDEAPISVKVKFRQVVKWALHRRQQALASKLTTKNYGNLRYSPPDRQGANWIRTDRLFVTVVSKSNEPSSLPDKLLTALRLWMPEPHRLLMSKMRAELDERGVLAEGEVLGNRCLQAGWMDEFLTEDSDERAWKIHNTINRHWEGLGDAIRSNVTEFAERLTNNLIAAGRDKAIKNWYQSLSPTDVKSQLNRYASCKPAVEGGHLTTGHVLRLDTCKGDGSIGFVFPPHVTWCPVKKAQAGPSDWVTIRHSSLCSFLVRIKKKPYGTLSAATICFYRLTTS